MPTSTPRSKVPAKARPTSNASLAAKMAGIEERLAAVEEIVNAAKARQQKAAAAKLAQNPEQLAALKALIDMAEGGA